jgi:hypothetical protein
MTLPTAGYFILHQNSVQQYLVQKVSAKLSGIFGTKVTVSSVYIDILSNIKLKGLCILDLRKDTLLYAPEFIVRPSSFTITSRFVELDRLVLRNPKINLYIDSTKTINLEFIVKKLESKDTSSTKQGWKFTFKNIKIENGDFTLKHFFKDQKEFGLNFTDLHLQPLNIKVTSLRTSAQGLEIKIKDINTKDHSGFQLNHFSARLKINRENMVYNNLKIETPESTIDADQAGLNFSSFKDLGGKSFYEKVKINLQLNSTDISTSDLSYIVGGFRKVPIKINISGNIKGRISDLKGRDVKINYGQTTHIKTSFDIIGLPNVKTTFWHINIKDLITTPGDITSIRLPGLRNGHINLPPNFKMFSYLSYKGKFTGFISDFVAYGRASSNLGSINSDLSLKPDSLNNLVFNGNLKMNQFKLGKFISNEEKIGDVTLNIQANGRMDASHQMYLRANGLIYSILYNNYNYQNISINGELSSKTFDGALSVNDPNIQMDFNGRVNFTDTIPVFKFSADVKHANLYRLHFDRKDSTASVSFYSTADFEGNTIDNIKGEINLRNSAIRKNNKQIEINNLLLFTQTVNDTNRIILRSSFADAEIWGLYKFTELIPSFKKLAKLYIPAVINDTTTKKYKGNSFQFDIDFKDSKQLVDFLFPGLYISKDSELKGKYISENNDLSFLMKIPLLQHQSKKWYNVYFNGKSNDNTFSLVSGCRNLKLTNQLSLDNFTILSDFRNDSINLVLRWNNWDTIQYRGTINIAAMFHKSTTGKKAVTFTMKPSEITLKDTIWNIKTGLVSIDSTGVYVSQLKLGHNNQTINASGKISKEKDAALIATLENINLENLKTIYTPNKLVLGGIINGKAEFVDLLTNPVFNISLVTDSLSINKEILGKTYLNAKWNNHDKNIAIHAHAERGNLKTLEIDGIYTLQSNNLDFTVDLNKLKMNILEPFLSSIFSEIRGIASGKLKVTGKTSEPLINGEVKTQKSGFMVNYLKTRYNFTHTISIRNNTFEFKNVAIFDSKSNKAYLNGTIFFEKLKNLHVNLSIAATNFECLNTTEKDNTLFYGKGYATGSIGINGTAPKIDIDITATTNRNTAIFIPLTTRAELSESNFIRFVQKRKEVNPFDKYEIDNIANKQEYTINAPNLNLNLNLKVTPDADVQIIFDQKIGDLIKGSGSGDFVLDMENGIFNMYGVYTIQNGEYLFTLQNVINKKFIVENGGTISWDGNPMDATVNINAVYDKKIKTKLNELFYGAGLIDAVSNPNYLKPLPVECRLKITDKLMNPSIYYDIYLPDADQTERDFLASALSDNEEKSKQFLSLLFLNRFIPNIDKESSNAQAPSGISAAGVTGIEFLSNQFSNWLSQISKDFDVGINYHPGDEISDQEVEVALSTQIWNDRVTLNGNVDVRGNKYKPTGGEDGKNNSTTDIVGDFDMDVKITDNGKLRLKVFNRANESYIEEYSPYTQGIGLFYKQEFNNLFKLIFTRKEKKIKPENEKTDTEPAKEEKTNDTIGLNK